MSNNNNNKAKGILRSKPRYSAENNSTRCTPITATSNSSDGPSISGNGNGNSSVVRSLADLVRSSAELSAEAAGITNADVGRVVSHHGVPSNAQHAAVRLKKNNTNNILRIEEQEETIITEGIPLLQISESGAPYLKIGGDAAAVYTSNIGPAVLDANGDIAFGIVGEDGEHVRFCELNDDNGKENDEHISSRERIQHRINVHDASDEDVVLFDQEEEPTTECNISDSESDATDDDAILEELGMSELIPSEHDSDYQTEEQPFSNNSINSGEMRAFLTIWQTLSRWVTPVTIEFLQCQDTTKKLTPEPQWSTVTEESPNNETSERRSVEIGASRRSGIMSMIRMYIARSITELKRMPNQTQQQKDALNDQRKVEQRLANLVQTFDINGPVANFNAKQWKVMTTILIVISFPSLETDSVTLPASAQTLGMTTDEYRYLTRSALNSLSNAV
jgi:hypothetical protein